MANERTDIEKVPPSGESPVLRPSYPSPLSYGDAAYGYGYGEEEGLRLREIWRLIRKHKWLILSITLVITTIVTIEVNRARPVYMASAFIELGKESPAVRTGNGEAVIQA